MAKAIAEARQILDPDNTPVRVVNKIEAIAISGTQIVLMLTTSWTKIEADKGQFLS
jgi:hypothetical protein